MKRFRPRIRIDGENNQAKVSVCMEEGAAGEWVRFADVSHDPPLTSFGLLSLQKAERERDAANKLAEHHFLARRAAEDDRRNALAAEDCAQRLAEQYRDELTALRERHAIVEAELADQRRVYGEACAELAALREERDGLRASLGVKLCSNIEAPTIELLKLAASVGETALVRRLLRVALGAPAPAENGVLGGTPPPPDGA